MTSQALYDAALPRYSSPATAARVRLLLPYLFLELSAFATVEDLVTHLRTSDARYRAALPAEFLDRNPPPMYITLYFIVTRLPDSLHAGEGKAVAEASQASAAAAHCDRGTSNYRPCLHLLSTAVERQVLPLSPAVPPPLAAARSCSPGGLPPHAPTSATSTLAEGLLQLNMPPLHRLSLLLSTAALLSTNYCCKQLWGFDTPFFEGCSPSPLAPSYASAAAVDVLGAEDVGAASASGKRRSSKGKGGRGGGNGSGGGGGGSSGGGGGSGDGRGAGSGGGSGGFGGGGGDSGGGGGSGGSGSGGGRDGATQRGGSGGAQRHGSCPYVIRTGDRAGQTCGKPHTQHHYFSRLDDAWRTEFGDEAERPRWAALLRSGVAIFDLDYDAILAAMYALSVSAQGDCYLCVPPDPGIEAAALGASESTLPGTAPAEALHNLTLDSDASHCFFCDSTTLTPLFAPVPVRLADPSGGLVLARSSTILPCPAVSSSSLSGLDLPSFSTNLVSTAAFQDAMVTTTTPGGQRVSISTCRRMGRYLATFTRRPGLSPVAPPCSCRLLSHQTLLWHHRLGHPSLPRLRGMQSCLLVSGLPWSLPPLPPSPAPPCLPCVEGRQRAAPHSSSFSWMTAPLQTLHMEVWGPARVSGQGRERYFLLVVDDYTRYTTVFPLRTKGEVPNVLIPWIRAYRLQLRERFRQEHPVLRLHFDRGGEFSSDLLRDFCHGEGPAPSGVSQEDPLPGTVPVEVAVDSGAARGAASGGAEPGSAESEGAGSGGAKTRGVEPGGAKPDGVEPGGAEPAGEEPGGAKPDGVEPGGAESESAESGGAKPWGTASSGGSVGASPRLSPRPVPLSLQQLRECFAHRTRFRSGAAGVGDSRAGGAGATSLGGAGVTHGAGGAGAPPNAAPRAAPESTATSTGEVPGTGST
ncbi:unnamed protein product [Closterium sp. NIES-54]